MKIKLKLANFFLNNKKEYSKVDLICNWWIGVIWPTIILASIIYLTTNSVDFLSLFENTQWFFKAWFLSFFISILIGSSVLFYKLFTFLTKKRDKKLPQISNN